MPFCPKCKNEYRKGFTVCHECKIPLVDTLEEAEAASSPQKRVFDVNDERSYEFLDQYKERVEETIHSFDEKDSHTNERFDEHTGNLNDLQERIMELRNEIVNIQNVINRIPGNIDARMINMEESYNRLADRVADLENGR